MTEQVKIPKTLICPGCGTEMPSEDILDHILKDLSCQNTSGFFTFCAVGHLNPIFSRMSKNTWYSGHYSDEEARMAQIELDSKYAEFLILTHL